MKVDWLGAKCLPSAGPIDQIVVPFRERRDPLQALQTVQGMATVVMGLLLTALSIERLF